MFMFILFFLIEVLVLWTNSAELLNSIVIISAEWISKGVKSIISLAGGEFNRNLLISLVGGEITLITLLFTLLPVILEKREDEYYLGKKVTDFFLFENHDEGKLVAIWKQAAILLGTVILCCYLKFFIGAYVISFVFLVFLVKEIFSFLNFISDREIVKKQIVQKVNEDLVINEKGTIESFVDTSKNNLRCIVEIMDYLISKENSNDLLVQYIDRVFDEKTKYKENVLVKLSEIIKEREYYLDVFLDTHEIYKFFRNSINDFSKEEFYELIYSLMINNYNCYVSVLDEKRRENYSILFLQAIDSSELSQDGKIQFKRRIVRSILSHAYPDLKLANSDPRYNKVFEYLFKLLKYLIDSNDIEIYRTFIKENKHFDDSPLLMDIYTTNEVYFYYLLELEIEKYVSEKEKKIYSEMRKMLLLQYDFESLLCNKHYYEQLEAYLKLLRIISQWWDRMDYDEGMKTCVVPAMIESVCKGLRLIFGRDYFAGEYRIDRQVIDSFKYDFEKGKLKEKCIERIIRFYDYIGYKNENRDIERFENQYMNYISGNYKDAELAKCINYAELEDRVSKEVKLLGQAMNELPIVNGVECTNTRKKTITHVYERDLLDGYYAEKALLPISDIQRRVEIWISKEMSAKIDQKINYSNNDADSVMKKLDEMKGDWYYIRPKTDHFRWLHKTRTEYDQLIESYRVIETNAVIKERFLLEDFCSSFKVIDFSVKPLNKEQLKMQKVKYKISEDEYYVANSDSIEILYGDDEIERYLENSLVQLDINMEIGVDVIGDNNIVFIRDEE